MTRIESKNILQKLDIELNTKAFKFENLINESQELTAYEKCTDGLSLLGCAILAKFAMKTVICIGMRKTIKSHKYVNTFVVNEIVLEMHFEYINLLSTHVLHILTPKGKITLVLSDRGEIERFSDAWNQLSIHASEYFTGALYFEDEKAILNYADEKHTLTYVDITEDTVIFYCNGKSIKVINSWSIQVQKVIVSLTSDVSTWILGEQRNDEL